MPAVNISVPFIEDTDDDLLYRGVQEPPIELTAAQRLTLRRIEAGMRDAGVPFSARRFPDDVVRHVIDLITAAAP